MGLGVYFGEDIARVLRGVGESVNLLVAQRGLHSAADTIGRQLDAAYVAGYWAALRTVATSFGVHLAEVRDPVPAGAPELAEWISTGHCVWEGEG